MSKHRWLLFTVLIFCLCLIGCKQKAKSSKAKTIRITVPAWYDPQRVPAVAAAVDGWNNENPDLPAEVSVLIGKRDAFLQKVMLGAKRGDFADAVLVRNEWLGRLAADNLIQPLPPDMAARIRENALPGLIPAVSKDNRVWAVPFDADVFVAWVRRDLMTNNPARAKGWHASSFQAWARNMTSVPDDKIKRFGFAFPASRTQNSALVFLNWYLSFGGAFNQTGRGIGLDQNALIQAMEYLQVFINQKSAPPNVVALKQNDVFSGLAGGAYGMTAGGSWERGMLNRQSRISDQIQSFMIPTPSRRPGPSLLGGWSFVLLNKHPEKTPAALETFFSRDIQVKKLQANSLLPANRTCLTDTWFTENRDGAVFSGALDRGTALPLSKETGPLLDRLAVVIANVFTGRQTPKQAVEEAFND
jgi:ABC-type glycerol-3-phosphate transport system substrate-binding protein